MDLPKRLPPDDLYEPPAPAAANTDEPMKKRLIRGQALSAMPCYRRIHTLGWSMSSGCACAEKFGVGILSSGKYTDMVSSIYILTFYLAFSDIYFGILSDICFGILSDTYFGILSDTYFGILSDIYSERYLAYFLTFYLAF